MHHHVGRPSPDRNTEAGESSGDESLGTHVESFAEVIGEFRDPRLTVKCDARINDGSGSEMTLAAFCLSSDPGWTTREARSGTCVKSPQHGFLKMWMRPRSPQPNRNITPRMSHVTSITQRL
eukprot:CAMPEP_0194528482 /NCGR_PEP_ID=MMETSP0253-20130528/64886_1 /TAXON_ID=2966 /ORGANISM="Noctiluca scintillans" /LENGTH=121 /DNA_ID=CAMNT_0039373531 /DNA_START=137 /DNA_END=498 /DNA_ORIENTATION=-